MSLFLNLRDVKIMYISFHKSFIKDLKKQSLQTKKKFIERRNMFLLNQYDPALSNHALSGSYTGCRSINVTGDIRAIFYIYEDMIIFIRIGTHAELYK